MIDLFFHDGAVEIVGAEAQGDLGDARSEHDPVGFDVIEIIEQQARYGDVAEVGVARGLGNVREPGVIGMEGQRDEGDEAVGLVLQLAELEQVVDALFFGFHVTIEHGGIGAQADFVGLARDAEPHLAADFVVANNFAHAGMGKISAPPPGKESTPASFSFRRVSLIDSFAMRAK